MNEIVMDNNGLQRLRARKLSLREVLKNEKGLTLIELLAVIVIIAIIAAIAIPSIGSIIEKTRINAHRSNAHMIIDAARLYVSNEGVSLAGAATLDLTLKDLNDKGYLELIPKDPSNKPNTYVEGAAAATATPPVSVSAPASVSYVHVSKDANGNFQYQVTLFGTQKYADLTSEANIEKSGYVEESKTPTAPTTP